MLTKFLSRHFLSLGPQGVIIIVEGWNRSRHFYDCCAHYVGRRNHKTAMNSWQSPWNPHYGYVIMGAIASQITSLTIVYSTVYSVADQRKHRSSASLAFVRGNHRGPVNSTHKWPVTRKMFPFDDVIMNTVEHYHGNMAHDEIVYASIWSGEHLLNT